jgi:two-component system CheB/CheR fusion protein
LRGQDDGVGMPKGEQPSGMGLRIMRYRAGVIGATLEVESSNGSGTVVTCTLKTNGRHGQSRE